MRAIAAAVLASCLAVEAAAAEPLALDVAKAEAAFDQRTGEPIITARLSEASRAAFARFTTDHVGRKIEIRVNREVMSAPVLRTPIIGGSLLISGNLTIDDARKMAHRLSSGEKIEVEAVDR